MVAQEIGFAQIIGEIDAVAQALGEPAAIAALATTNFRGGSPAVAAIVRFLERASVDARRIVQLAPAAGATEQRPLANCYSARDLRLALDALRNAHIELVNLFNALAQNRALPATGELAAMHKAAVVEMLV